MHDPVVTPSELLRGAQVGHDHGSDGSERQERSQRNGHGMSTEQAEQAHPTLPKGQRNARGDGQDQATLVHRILLQSALDWFVGSFREQGEFSHGAADAVFTGFNPVGFLTPMTVRISRSSLSNFLYVSSPPMVG